MANNREVSGTLVRTSKQAVVLTKADRLKKSVDSPLEVCQTKTPSFYPAFYFILTLNIFCFPLDRSILPKIRIYGDDTSDSFLSLSHTRQSRRANKIVYHPDFNETSLRNNLAVIIVRKHLYGELVTRVNEKSIIDYFFFGLFFPVK